MCGEDDSIEKWKILRWCEPARVQLALGRLQRTAGSHASTSPALSSPSVLRHLPNPLLTFVRPPSPPLSFPNSPTSVQDFCSSLVPLLSIAVKVLLHLRQRTLPYGPYPAVPLLKRPIRAKVLRHFCQLTLPYLGLAVTLFKG
jgi:hypothetical protein